ncbi:unnamed protein product [Sphagnum troendelagicum]|uniref:NADH dehydrogenase-like complex O n=1 Tax=Sphagnum troendelagicum TaxID=128251 RepID=A0ABP0U6P9_9BRYO
MAAMVALSPGVLAPTSRNTLHFGPTFRSSKLLCTGQARSHRRGRRLRVTAVEAEPSSVPPPTPDGNITPAPKKPTLTKGQIVRVDKEKYLNSIEYLSVGHPTYFKGLDYIYEDRGEVLDIRFFDHGEYALLAWAGIPTAPAWLPTYMLIKSEKLSYRRT